MKSLLFIIVVICIFTVFRRERERSGKKKEVFLPHTLFASQTASHYSLAIISADVQVSIANVGFPLSSSLY